ncbi:MAG TPA: hypothetical protein VFE37_23680 [Chloroflexota bacterium]|nr:hypothetical protein [Chloroflexota bacterium]
MLHLPSSRLRRATLAAVAGLLLSAELATAQLGDPSGPGQSVPAPPPQCPQTVACTYSEHNSLGPNGGYRFQMLNVCGANCSTQYWVSDAASGKMLLALDPVRGGGIVAVGRSTSETDTHPPVRVVVPDYGPNDPACCPSNYRDTTYTWDAGTSSLVAGTPRLVPTEGGPGWEGLREQLRADGFFDVFPQS